MINSFKKARLIAGMTQTELAERLGVSTVAVSKWESGKNLPKAKRLPEVARVLQTTASNLLSEEERAVRWMRW